MTISANVINKYSKLANVFIETGTHTGNTVELARKAGFGKIYTIELSDKFYKAASARFSRHQNIVCIHGNSSTKIQEILTKLNEPAVFWLDGHWSMGDTAKGDKDVPLYDELLAIGEHHVKNHIILIDDIRLLGNKNELVTGWHNMSLDKIKELCSNINSNYTFSTEHGHVPNDILVARVR